MTAERIRAEPCNKLHTGYRVTAQCLTELSFNFIRLEVRSSHTRYRNVFTPFSSHMHDPSAIVGHPPLPAVNLQMFCEVV